MATLYGTMPSPQIAAAAVAERTKRMRIGLAVSILPFANPVRIAEDYAMVDVIAGVVSTSAWAEATSPTSSGCWG